MNTEEERNVSKKNLKSIIGKISIGIGIICVLFFPIFSISTSLTKSSGNWLWFIFSLLLALIIFALAIESKSTFFVILALVIGYIGFSLSGFIVTPYTKIAIIKHEENIVATKIPCLTWPYGKTITYKQRSFLLEQSFVLKGTGNIITAKIEFEVNQTKIKQIIEKFGSYEIWAEEAKKLVYSVVDDSLKKGFDYMFEGLLSKVESVKLKLSDQGISRFREMYMVLKSFEISFRYKEVISWRGAGCLAFFCEKKTLFIIS